MALTDNLVAYWTLDESSDGSGAVTREDSTASNNDLTDNNTTASGTGIISNGADFERANTEYLSITDAAQTGLDLAGDFTMKLWVNFESIPANDEYYTFMSKFATSNRQYAFFLGKESDVVKLLSFIGDGVNDGDQDTVTWTPSTATWYMVTLRYTHATLKIDFSVNASAQGAQQTSSVSLGAGGAAFRMGETEIASRLMDGILDEAGVWSRRLTDV